MWVRPGPDKTPVPRVSFATRVGDLGCGVGYTNKPFQIHEILWGAEVRRPCHSYVPNLYRGTGPAAPRHNGI